MEQNFKIGIIGGAGRMGRLFHRLFEKKGYEVIITDRNVGPNYKDLLSQAKVILLSLPMEVFPQVVKEIAPYVEKHHWIMDICSLKVEPVRVMRKYLTKGELIGTHPLFGPYESDLNGKIFAYYPIRGKNFKNWLLSLLKEEGLKVIQISPQKHDKLMALIQVINHFWLLLLAKTIHHSGYSLREIVAFSTPSFQAQLEILKRLANQDEDLYARIQLENPFGKKLRNLLCRNCKDLTRFFNLGGEVGFNFFKENFRLAKELAKELETLLPVKVEEEGKTCQNH